MTGCHTDAHNLTRRETNGQESVKKCLPEQAPFGPRAASRKMAEAIVAQGNAAGTGS
jgi:hypothetical protein